MLFYYTNMYTLNVILIVLVLTFANIRNDLVQPVAFSLT